MGFSIYSLKSGDTELVDHLAPKEMIDRITKSGYEAIFAAEDETLTPCGLVIFNFERGRVDIVWVNVFETYRFRGVGSMLMDQVFDLAIVSGFSQVGLRLTGELADPDNVDAATGFADYWGFTYGHYIKDRDGHVSYLFTAEAKPQNASEYNFKIAPMFGEDKPDKYRWLKTELYGDRSY